jgi:hypothetical protein
LPLRRRTGSGADPRPEHRLDSGVATSDALSTTALDASRFSATAVESISMCPSSSVAVFNSMSRYFTGPRAPHAWKKYCMHAPAHPARADRRRQSARPALA